MTTIPTTDLSLALSSLGALAILLAVATLARLFTERRHP